MRKAEENHERALLWDRREKMVSKKSGHTSPVQTEVKRSRDGP